MTEEEANAARPAPGEEGIYRSLGLTNGPQSHGLIQMALDYVHLFEPEEKVAAQELFELNIRAEKRIYQCYGLDADNNPVAYDNSIGRALYRATMRALAVGIEIGRRPLRHRPAA